MADGTYTAADVQVVHIYADRTYTPTADFFSGGHVQFDVDYPPDKNFCEIKLQIEFKKKLEEDGGTVKIER